MKIESIDDRSGGPLSPGSFGYIYFSDGVRVGYAPGLDDRPPVWQPYTDGGGKYREARAEHLRQAMQYLYDHGVIVSEKVG